jgi:MFS family permease
MDMHSSAEGSSWRELIAGETGLATATVSLGIVLFAFNAFVVATALPSAVSDLGGRAWIAWATSLYLILSIVTGASAAAAMHRLGARRLFVLAGLIFLAGTLIAAAAPNMALLLVGRALQGAGAGFIESGCYVLIPRLFPPRLIPRVFGVEAVAWAVAAFGGPALAGLLTATLSWRAALLVSVPLALLFLILVPRVVREGERAETVTGLPLLPLAGVAAGMGLILVSDGAGTPGLKLATLALGFALFAAVVRFDRHARAPLLPPGAFGFGHPAGLGLWITLMMPVAQAAGTVFLTYALQMLWHYSPFASGLAATVLALSWSGVQTLAASRPWPRMRLVIAGTLFMAAGEGAMALAFGLTQPALMILAQVLIGAAGGSFWGALSQIVMESAAEAHRSTTSGLLPSVLSTGYGIGAALCGLIANMLGFSVASGAELQRVMTLVFLIAMLPGLVSFALALRMAGQLRRAGAGAASLRAAS